MTTTPPSPSRIASWKYPDWFYSFDKTFTDPATKKQVRIEFLMMDTVIASATEDGQYSDELKDEWPHLGAMPPEAPTAAQQWMWLEATLKASTADYVWVGGHFPVWTGCAHAPTPILVEKLKPLLEKVRPNPTAHHPSRVAAKRG